MFVSTGGPLQDLRPTRNCGCCVALNTALHVLVCLSVCEQDHTKSSQAIFTKSCRIMEYCYGKNRTDFVVCLIQSGRMAAMFHFLQLWRHLGNSLKMNYFIIHVHQMAHAYCFAEVCGLLAASSRMFFYDNPWQKVVGDGHSSSIRDVTLSTCVLSSTTSTIRVRIYTCEYGGVMRSVASVSVSVCLSCSCSNFWQPWPRNFIFGVRAHLQNM